MSAANQAPIIISKNVESGFESIRVGIKPFLGILPIRKAHVRDKLLGNKQKRPSVEHKVLQSSFFNDNFMPSNTSASRFGSIDSQIN